MLLLTAKLLTEEAKKMLKAGLIVLEGNEIRMTEKASRILDTIAITDTNSEAILNWADEEIARQEEKRA